MSAAVRVTHVNGISLDVDLTTVADDAVDVFSDVDCTTPVTMPATITADTTLYVTEQGTYKLSVLRGAIEVAGPITVALREGPASASFSLAMVDPLLLESASPSGTSSPSASGEILPGDLPPEVEFAFWGYYTGGPRFLVFALRVVAGPVDVSLWNYDYAVTTLTAGFDAAELSDTATATALQTGEYVVLSCPSSLTQAQYQNYVNSWGFDPRSFLPGAWNPAIPEGPQVAVNTPYTNLDSGLTAVDVQNAIDELTARIVALETP